MHEKERLLLLTLPFFFILLFGCNQRDIVVNITPVSSAINSAYISSGDEQSRVISDCLIVVFTGSSSITVYSATI